MKKMSWIVSLLFLTSCSTMSGWWNQLFTDVETTIEEDLIAPNPQSKPAVQITSIPGKPPLLPAKK